MSDSSTTIRVSHQQRERLRVLAEQRATTMSATLDDALEALRRDVFYRSMATAEVSLRADPEAWEQYNAERAAWLNADLSTT